MANEITAFGLQTDLRLAQMISQEVRLLINDTSNLRNSPYMDYVGSINGLGSDTIRVRQAAYGRDLFSEFSDATEKDQVTETALTDASVDVAVKRLAMAFAITDMASMTGLGGANEVDPFRLAQAIATSYDASFASMTASTFSSFSNAIAGGTSLAVDDFMNAYQQLQTASSNRGVDGPFVAVLHPKQFNELQDSINALTGGALVFQPALGADVMGAKGKGFKGSFLGVDIYTSSYITDDSTNFKAAMWGPGAIGYADGSPAIMTSETMSMGPVTIEMDRDARKAVTRVVGHAYLGLSILENDRGVRIESNI
jgi:hypothetical protein